LNAYNPPKVGIICFFSRKNQKVYTGHELSSRLFDYFLSKRTYNFYLWLQGNINFLEQIVTFFVIVFLVLSSPNDIYICWFATAYTFVSKIFSFKRYTS